jgi:hypothetical protein
MEVYGDSKCRIFALNQEVNKKKVVPELLY